MCLMTCYCPIQFDQVCKIVEVLGVPPAHVLDKASRTEKFFERTSTGTWILHRHRDGRKVTSLVHVLEFSYMYCAPKKKIFLVAL